MGFDILSNIACEVRLEDPDRDAEDCVTDVMLSTLTTCLTSSPDRFQIISSLDILNKLCQQDDNNEFICHVLISDQSLYNQLVIFLSLHDIHLLISSLECLYSLSCLGETSCNAIVRTHGALDALVSLMTVEAQSYGPKACILMRVVETVPGNHVLNQVQQQQPQQQSMQVVHVQANAAVQQQQPKIVVQTQQAQQNVTPITTMSQVIRGPVVVSVL